MTKWKGITLKIEVKEKLEIFKALHNCSTFNDAVEKLISEEKLYLDRYILNKFRMFRDYENCKSDSEGLKLLLVRNIKSGHPLPELEDLLDELLSEY